VHTFTPGPEVSFHSDAFHKFYYKNKKKKRKERFHCIQNIADAKTAVDFKSILYTNMRVNRL
jgi:hypothetical protein